MFWYYVAGGAAVIVLVLVVARLWEFGTRCSRCSTTVISHTDFRKRCASSDLPLDHRGSLLGSFADQSKISLYRKIESKKGFSCRDCDTVYCMECLYNHAGKHAEGGKACPKCGGRFDPFESQRPTSQPTKRPETKRAADESEQDASPRRYRLDFLVEVPKKYDRRKQFYDSILALAGKQNPLPKYRPLQISLIPQGVVFTFYDLPADVPQDLAASEITTWIRQASSDSEIGIETISEYNGPFELAARVSNAGRVVPR